MDERVLMFDEKARQLEALIKAELRTTRPIRYVAELLDRAHGGAQRPAEGLAGPAAAAYLNGLIEAIAKELRADARGYSAARWLWYLRRLPDEIFAGFYSTTIGYDRALAESLTWFSDRIETSATVTAFGFRVDESAARHITRFVFAVRLLSHLHSIYRRIGKGAWLFFENGLPLAEQDDDVAEAIRLYDSRHEDREFDHAALGVVGPISAPGFPSPDEELLILLFAPCSTLPVPIDAPRPDGQVVPATVIARHIFRSVPIESFLRPYGAPSASTLPFLQQIEPLVILHTLFPLLCAELPAMLSGSLQVGYAVLTSSRLERLVSTWLPPLRKRLLAYAPHIDWSREFTEWFTRVKAIEPDLWPLRRGGCIREAGDAVMVDIIAASVALQHLTAVDRSDAGLANTRAETFELQVQAIIDDSSWRPDETSRSLRGRPLRRSGQHLTDIDALGASNGELLLVSCKGLIYDADYDRGTHRVVTNRETVVDQAVEDWERRIADLNANPHGDNFDLSAFKGRIVGVVCTPFVVYSRRAPTLSFARPGLRRCLAPFELRAALGDTPGAGADGTEDARDTPSSTDPRMSTAPRQSL